MSSSDSAFQVGPRHNNRIIDDSMVSDNVRENSPPKLGTVFEEEENEDCKLNFTTRVNIINLDPVTSDQPFRENGLKTTRNQSNPKS